MSKDYKPNGGVLGCPKISAKDFKEYSDDINSRIDSDGSLKRVPVAKLMDKEWDNDYDVYVEYNPEKVSIVHRIFGSLTNTNINDTCYSAQIGKYQTDIIDLKHPSMGAPFYSASCGLIVCFLLKNSLFKLRATDLCCSLNNEEFIISTDPTKVYAFLGIDLEKLLQTHTRQELFNLIEQSWIYDPDVILQLRGTKTKDINRPIFVDFLDFCETHQRISKIQPKTLEQALTHFEKTSEYYALELKQQEENRIKKLRSNTKDLLLVQFKKKNIIGKELGEKMNQFKNWIFQKYGIDYDTWSITDNLDVDSAFNQFYLLFNIS
jgi:hypothetical protein